MPPTIGAAMRCITSEPVPLPHMIGSRPAMMTATVIAFGRTRSTAPSRMASSRSSVPVLPGARRSFQACLQIEQHDHAELRRHAGQRDEAHGAGDRHVVAEQLQQPEAADQRERQRGHDQQRLVEAPEGQIQQHEDDAAA